MAEKNLVCFPRATVTLLLATCIRGSSSFIYSQRSIESSLSLLASGDNNMQSKEQGICNPVIDLQMHTSRKPPTEGLSYLSQECERLGIGTYDVYGDFNLDSEKSYLRKFESEMAHHFGKEDAVFCLSGGVAQSIALAINARKHRASLSNDDHDRGMERIKAFACHPTSHLLLHENNNFHELLGMQAVVLNPTTEDTTQQQTNYDPDDLKENGCYGMDPVRLSHVQDMFDRWELLDSTTVVYPKAEIPMNRIDLSTFILELPHREIGGKLTPWDEVEEIAKLCEKQGVQFHCDGARIFEASVGYRHKSVKQTAHPFSSVYISFYKGLGSAYGGAMLLGDVIFCNEVRVWLRRFGGNLYSVLPYAVSAWAGFRRNCIEQKGKDIDLNPESLLYCSGVFEHRQRKLARILKLLQADSKISTIVKFDPAVPQTNMVHGYLKVSYDECIQALDAVEKSTGIRVLSRVRKCKITSDGSNSKVKTNRFKFGCRFEWIMGEANSNIDDHCFISGWDVFADTLNKDARIT